MASLEEELPQRHQAGEEAVAGGGPEDQKPPKSALRPAPSSKASPGVPTHAVSSPWAAHSPAQTRGPEGTVLSLPPVPSLEAAPWRQHPGSIPPGASLREPRHPPRAGLGGDPRIPSHPTPPAEHLLMLPAQSWREARGGRERGCRGRPGFKDGSGGPARPRLLRGGAAGQGSAGGGEGSGEKEVEGEFIAGGAIAGLTRP